MTQNELAAAVNYYTGWTTASAQDGVLTLAKGKLSLVCDGAVVFDEPVENFESFNFPRWSPGYMQIQLHGKRYRVDFYNKLALKGATGAIGAGAAVQSASPALRSAAKAAGVAGGVAMIETSLKPWNQWVAALEYTGKVKGAKSGMRHYFTWFILAVVLITAVMIVATILGSIVLVPLAIVSTIVFIVWVYRSARP